MCGHTLLAKEKRRSACCGAGAHLREFVFGSCSHYFLCSSREAVKCLEMSYLRRVLALGARSSADRVDDVQITSLYFT